MDPKVEMWCFRNKRIFAHIRLNSNFKINFCNYFKKYKIIEKVLKLTKKFETMQKSC